MKKQEMIAMILAGGRGTRLKSLTKKNAKPAVCYGGKYRIIDFPLSNCSNSGIDIIGVLTQYENVFLNSYIAQSSTWGLDTSDSGIFNLPPREREGKDFGVYRGTADAITQNIDFIESFHPENILILSGDHIYKMNYAKMLKFHKENQADCTIAVYDVPVEEASRFGIMNCHENMRIYEFEEKPKAPKSTLASMGIYIFKWDLLKKYLLIDEKAYTDHDFGKNIIPAYLSDDRKMFAYRFHGYWKDVGTVSSLWQANMDLLDSDVELDLGDRDMRIYTANTNDLPQYISSEAEVQNAFINQGCEIYGTVKNSILFTGVKVAKNAIVEDSVLHPHVIVEENAVVSRAIIGENVKVKKNQAIRGTEEIKLVVDGEE